MRIVAAAALVFCFAIGVAFSLALSNTPPEKPAPTQAASAAQALTVKSAFDSVSLLAQSAIVADLDNGTILYTQKPDVQLPLASITKVPLALVVSEVLPPDFVVTIGRDTGYNSKASQLMAGERYRTKDLLSYTLVASSNDGAETLAAMADEALQVKYPQAQGSATIWRMNDLARSLGLNSLYFLNPSGLDMSETQSGAYGSARDVARLFAYAVKAEPQIFAETAVPSIDIVSLDGRIAHAVNTDDALDSVPGVIMGKTGYTDLAGGNLAVAFASGGKRYVAVVLGSTQKGRFSDMRQLTAAVQTLSQQ